jgi:YVTN family beta-propeller protein
VINTSTNTIVNSIPVGVNPLKCHLSADGLFLYVSCNGNNTVYKINTSNLTVAHVFPTGSAPRNICTSPDGTKLYVANWSSFTMSVHSTAAPYQLIATVPVDYWPQAIWAQPNGEYVLVANFGFDLTFDHCSVIRTSDWQVIARLQTGAGPEDMVSIGEDGQYLYVSNWGMPCCFGVQYDYCCSSEINKGNITVIALPDFNQIVPPGTIPTEIPYIQSTLTTIPVQAEYSFGMAPHPSGEYVFVVNKDSHNMSVVGLSAGNTNLPAGDLCETAFVLTNLEDCITGSNSGFQDNYNESCPFTASGGRDLVYSYTPELTISGVFDMCSSGIDTKLYIYQDECGEYNSGEYIYCNDDHCGINGWRSYLDEVTLYSNHTYYIVVDAFGSTDCGEFELCFTMTCTSDLNQDGIIGVGDILAFTGGYGTLYDSSDLLVFLADFGQVCDP